jgi:hypothetical protein
MVAVRPTETSVHIEQTAIDHAQRLILQVCQIARSRRFIANVPTRLGTEGVHQAVAEHDSAVLFDWLMAELSYQGIADQVAADFMEKHGHASWEIIAADLRRHVGCPKLRSYWHFQNCRYNKSRYTCAEPDHLPRCPLPRQWLRNGRLNQTAYSLYLFIRDVAGGDLVGWIEHRLQAAAAQPGADPLASMRAAVIDPL